MSPNEPTAAKTFNVKIKESDSGLWFATSEDHPTMFLAYVGLDNLLARLPAMLRICLEQSHSENRQLAK